MEKDIFKLDDRIDKAMHDVLEKEQDFRKKTLKPKKKRKSNFKLWEELNEKHLKELGYIK